MPTDIVIIGDDMVTEEDVLKVLKATGKAMTAKEIAGFLGVKKEEISKILKKLKDRDLVTSPKRCYYSFREIGEGND